MPDQYLFGRFALRPAQRQLLIDGQPAVLGARAFDVLLALVENRERLVSKNELLDFVWPGLVVEENNLQVHVSALRKLLGPQAIDQRRRIGPPATALAQPLRQRGGGRRGKGHGRARWAAQGMCRGAWTVIPRASRCRARGLNRC